MRFSVGFFDAIFGEKLEVELPGDDGPIRRRVTRKWLEKLQREGKASRIDNAEITATVLTPRGIERRVVTIGRDLTMDDYGISFDSDDRTVYALEFYRDGVIERRYVPKDDFLRAKSLLGE